MRATVKTAYFDRSGLHKVGAVVDVDASNPYVVFNEVKPVKTEKKEEAKAETKKESKPRRKTTKKG